MIRNNTYQSSPPRKIPFVENAASDDLDSTSSNCCRDDDNDSDSERHSPIYYFAYGPMVHPMVRHRRGARCRNEQAAVLRDHRLTFAVGGLASVIQQTGYDVHGVIMECCSKEDWEKLQAYEAGYVPAQVQVYPYPTATDATGKRGSGDESDLPVLDLPTTTGSNLDDSSSCSSSSQYITARIFVIHETDVSAEQNKTIERLPREGYLRLMATGMAKYDGDEVYINDHIMSVPFKPVCKPEDYATFPVLRLPPLGSQMDVNAAALPLVVDTTSNNQNFTSNHLAKCPSTISATLTESEDMTLSSKSIATITNKAEMVSLPKVSLEGYRKFCQTLPDKLPHEEDFENQSMITTSCTATCSSTTFHSTSMRTSSSSCHCCSAYPSQMLFRLGNHIILIHNPPGPQHPGAYWLQRNAHAKLQDITYYLQKTHADPDVSYCESPKDITAHHQAWAENMLVESIAQGLSAYRVFELSKDCSEEEEYMSIQRLKAFLKASSRRTGITSTKSDGCLRVAWSTTSNFNSRNKSSKFWRRRGGRNNTTISKLTNKLKWVAVTVKSKSSQYPNKKTSKQASI